MNNPAIHRPTYNPDEISVGIAHFGVGNFHRSHQAMYLDRLMALGGHETWGIIGIGVMPGDVSMRDALAEQSYRYTLVEKSGDGGIFAREIASLRGYLFAPDDPATVLALLAQPEIRIVSLTITEGGYNIDRATGAFDLQNPSVQHDLTDPQHPVTVFGYITEALRVRRERGVDPFTVMSCDNLPGNGHVIRQAILAFANAHDAQLAAWIAAEVSFPNSMVDRITPVTTDADREMVAETFGINDAWPVVTEPFTQWVLEDQFGNGRPAFEQVGVQLVDDVAPYELMKLRLLNASHQAMAYIGMLCGYTYVHEAVADSGIEQFLRAYLQEARVTLPSIPGIDVDAYIESLFERFRNPYIADTLARLAVDASDRIPKFVLPAVRENLAADRPVTMGAAVIASWIRYLQITPTVVDTMSDSLIPLATNAPEFIGYESVFGELGTDDRFTTETVLLAERLRDLPPQEWLHRLVGSA